MPRQGESLGKYELVRRIGLGGMAEVWLARVSGPGGFTKTLVVKTVLEHHSQNEEFIAQFFDEARLAALLTHPNIAQIFELGEHEKIFYIAMEYVRGQDLQALSKAANDRFGGLPYPLLARVGCGVCEGLHYAHELTDEDGNPLSLVHRDVSPENILISYDGVVKLVDFGIAKATINQVTTRAGLFKGKLQFAAPQRFLNLPLDRRDDIYSLGAVLYKVATGVAPIHADSDGLMIKKILDGEFPSPKNLRPDLPDEIDAVILKCMEWDPVDRYQSCREVQRDLEKYIASTGQPVTTFEVSQFMRRCFTEELEQSSLEIAVSADVAEEEDVPGPLEAPETEADLPQHGTVFGLGGQQKPVMSASKTRMGHPIAEEKMLSPSRQAALAQKLQQQARERERDQERDEEAFKPKRTGLVAAIAIVSVLLLAGVGVLLLGPWGRDDDRPEPDAALAARNDTGPLHTPGPTKTTDAGPAADAAPTGDAASTLDAAVAADGGREAGPEKIDVSALQPVKRTGTLKLSGPAGCTAHLGDEDLGALPLTRDLNAGQYKVAIRCPGGVNREVEVTIAEGAETEETISSGAPTGSGSGKLLVLVRPWAEVYVNGRKVGITPLGAIPLPVGSHSVKLVNSEIGVTKNERVRIRPGQQTTLRVILR